MEGPQAHLQQGTRHRGGDGEGGRACLGSMADCWGKGRDACEAGQEGGLLLLLQTCMC